MSAASTSPNRSSAPARDRNEAPPTSSRATPLMVQWHTTAIGPKTRLGDNPFRRVRAAAKVSVVGTDERRRVELAAAVDRGTLGGQLWQPGLRS